MKGLQSAICDRALAPDGSAPEWVHLLPDGKMTGRDGREFDLVDPAALVLAFQSRGIDLVVDYEHQSDKPEAKLSGPVPAAGWIKELKAKASGLWGRVEWTATASEMISRKEYRYLSPSFQFHPKTRQIVHLNGAGLVHNPNLYLTALASQDTAMQPADAPPTDLLKQLTELLGLPADASPKDLMAKIAALLVATPDPAKYMPVTAVQEMLADRHLERSTNSEKRVLAKVNEASSKGYILGGSMREWALALCRSDEVAFDTFLETSGPRFAYLQKAVLPAGPPPKSYLAAHAASHTGTGSDLEAAVCAQLGLKPGSLAD